MIRGAEHGIKLKAPLFQEKDILVGFEFVNDTDIAEGDLTSTGINIEDI